MQFTEPKSWPTVENLQGLLFFTQRVQELSYPYTFYSYKAPGISITGLAQDVITALSRDWPEQSKAKQASHLLDELRVRISGNKALARLLHMPPHLYLPADILDKRKSISLIKTFLAEINEHTYLATLTEMIFELAGSPAKKWDIDALASEFVSTLQYLGVSREHIHSSIKDVFYNQDIPVSADTLFEFVKTVFPHIHQYVVLVPVSKNFTEFDQKSLETLRIKIADTQVTETASSKHALFMEDTKSDDFCVCAVSVEAMDYNSASEAARENIDRFGSLFQILSHKWQYRVGSVFVATQMCCDKTSIETISRSNAMHYIRDRPAKKALANFSGLLNSRAFLRGPDKSKYLNIIEIHGSSTRSATTDSQLINMWTCLETMVPADDSRSIVDRVAERVMPVMCLQHTKRLIGALMLDLFRWNRRAFSQSLKMYGDFESNLTHMRFLEMITNTNKEAPLHFLLEKIGDFELLKFRLANVAQMFRSNSKILNELDRFESEVISNIHRIYRMRNEIVHSGKSKRHISRYVEISHDYFDQCFEFSLSLSRRGRRFNEFATCFQFADSQYQHYRDVLNSSSSHGHCIWDFRATRGKSYIFDADRSDRGEP